MNRVRPFASLFALTIPYKSRAVESRHQPRQSKDAARLAQQPTQGSFGDAVRLAQRARHLAVGLCAAALMSAGYQRCGRACDGKRTSTQGEDNMRTETKFGITPRPELGS